MALPTTRFYLDDGTGTFPDDITTYVRLSDGFSITRGRADTENAPTAAVLNFMVNNSTGAFTPGATVLANPTTIKLDQQVKVVETVNGVAFTRFVGYVKTWALGWLDVAETTAIVRITATDAQARAERRILRSIVEEEILKGVPDDYYTFGEPAGATFAADTSGNQGPALTMAGTGADVVFGTDTGPGTDGLTAATFAGGKYLKGSGVPADASFIFAFASTDTVNDGDLLTQTDNSTSMRVTIRPSFGVLTLGSAGTTIGTGAYNDGNVHVLGLRNVAHATYDVYIDGVLTNSGVVVTTPLTGSTTVQLGAFVGSMAHFAQWASAPSGAAFIAMSQAMLTGFAGESGVARITRLAGYAGISMGSLDASLTNVPFVDITDSTAQQAMQDVVDAEMGVAYIAGDGTMTFHNRQRVLAKTVPDLTLNGFVKPDAQPTTDDQDLINYMAVASAITGINQVVRNTSSEAAHGRYDGSRTYLVATDQDALDRGNWIVFTRAEPAAAGRYPTLTINLYGMAPVQQAQVLTAMDQGCWLRAINMPSQTTGGTTVDEVVEGYVETQNETTWEITCNVVSKAALYPTVWILGTSALGVDTRLAV
jgi:hypothetical protein